MDPVSQSAPSADSFRYPIYFVHRVLTHWPELRDGAAPSVESLGPKFIHGRDNWTIQTYLQLKARGRDVHLVSEYVPGQINLMHADDLAIKHRPDRAFIAAVEPDRPRPVIADLRIVQNHLQIRGANDHFMPHWPQPGLIPRNPARGAMLQRVGYIGAPAYLAAPFRSEDFRLQLAGMGMELVIREKDYTHCDDLDAILAVRDVSAFDLSIKPASKLVNAWLAGCPALLGREPAYQKLRQSDLDFIEITSADDAIAALRKLKEAPALYQKMIANGQARAADFTTEKLSQLWENLITGPITDAYERWLKIPAPLRLMRFAVRSIEHKRQRRRFFRLIRT